MSERKPVQFQYVYGCGEMARGFIVMADDGTLWRWRENYPEWGWHQIDIAPLPQTTAHDC